MESTNTTNLLHATRASSREALEELSIDSGLQLATAFVVLLGMGLVIWELRQTREIAQVQHSQAGIGFFAQSVHSIMGENAAKSIANACDHPDDLTTGEMGRSTPLLHVGNKPDPPGTKR